MRLYNHSKVYQDKKTVGEGNEEGLTVDYRIESVANVNGEAITRAAKGCFVFEWYATTRRKEKTCSGAEKGLRREMGII